MQWVDRYLWYVRAEYRGYIAISIKLPYVQYIGVNLSKAYLSCYLLSVN